MLASPKVAKRRCLPLKLADCAFMAIGANSAAAGVLGNRNGGGKSVPSQFGGTVVQRPPLALPYVGLSAIKAPTACGISMLLLTAP